MKDLAPQMLFDEEAVCGGLEHELPAHFCAPSGDGEREGLMRAGCVGGWCWSRLSGSADLRRLAAGDAATGAIASDVQLAPGCSGAAWTPHRNRMRAVVKRAMLAQRVTYETGQIG